MRWTIFVKNAAKVARPADNPNLNHTKPKPKHNFPSQQTISTAFPDLVVLLARLCYGVMADMGLGVVLPFFSVLHDDVEAQT